MIGWTGALAGVLTMVASGATLYVAPDGNDSWPGTLAQPKATVTGARDAVRAMDRTEPLTVVVRGGTYRVSEPIQFSPEDSGTAGAPISYEAYPGEAPVISGGRPITGWQEDGGLWMVDLKAAWGETYAPFSALWVDGVFRHVARTPNEGFLHTAGKADKTTDPETGEEVDRGKTAFKFKPRDIQRWENLEDAYLVVYHSWDVSYNRVRAIEDDTNTVVVEPGTHWNFENWGPDQRYFVANVREALDAPGEWYLDRNTGVLTYWPMPGEDPTTTEVIAPFAKHLLLLHGDLENGRFVEHLTFKGLSFQHAEYTMPVGGIKDLQAAWHLPGAVEATGARHCTFDSCEITRVSTYGMWLHAGSQDNVVTRCHIHNLGGGGIRLGEGASPKTEYEVAARNTIDNNWIHDGGKEYPSAVGVWIARTNHNKVTHNEISDFFYTGVSVGWQWGYAPTTAHHNEIAYNHIHHLGKYVLSDMGGIYTLGIAPGTKLHHNKIHDVYSFYYGGWGIYPDEGSSDLLIENNVVYNTKTGGFHQHYGKHNLVRNNIFAFATEYQVLRTRNEEHTTFFFEQNIVYSDNGKILGSNWTNGNFHMDHNCYWDTSTQNLTMSKQSWADWQAAGHDQHSIVADPGFVDAEGRDFTLKEDSPALALGFKPIDLSPTGLYGDPEWVAGPKRAEEARE
jgi:hypothetical protein